VGKVGQTLLTFALPGLAGEQMAMSGSLAFQAAAGGAFETFGRAPVAFDFRHDVSSCCVFPDFPEKLKTTDFKKKKLPMRPEKGPGTIFAFGQILIIYL